MFNKIFNANLDSVEKAGSIIVNPSAAAPCPLLPTIKC